MSLRVYIAEHREAIIRDFGAFAKTLQPAGARMSNAELRDHAEEILTALLDEMAAAETPAAGRAASGSGGSRRMEAAGKLHADNRINHGFTWRAVLAEFHALRANVLRLYEQSGPVELKGVPRFNEAIDQALTESMNRFAMETDLFRDQFIGVLSHDLRTPLAAITTAAALLGAPEDDPQRRSRVVRRIMSSAQRMERMIADLLDLTRARLGGAIPVRRRPVDLAQVCDEAMLEIQDACPEAVLRLDACGNLRGLWDADRLAQVVSNLVGNAIQHGDGTPITLTAQDEGQSVTLAIHNGGSPIPADVLPRIFEPLTRAAGGPDRRSIGLGLFIARAIVAAHGGEIEASSSPDIGTTFTVKLPRGE
jgi:signal transduction histidine kinase